MLGTQVRNASRRRKKTTRRDPVLLIPTVGGATAVRPNGPSEIQPEKSPPPQTSANSFFRVRRGASTDDLAWGRAIYPRRVGCECRTRAFDHPTCLIGG